MSRAVSVSTMNTNWIPPDLPADAVRDACDSLFTLHKLRLEFGYTQSELEPGSFQSKSLETAELPFETIYIQSWVRKMFSTLDSDFNLQSDVSSWSHYCTVSSSPIRHHHSNGPGDQLPTQHSSSGSFQPSTSHPRFISVNLTRPVVIYILWLQPTRASLDADGVSPLADTDSNDRPLFSGTAPSACRSPCSMSFTGS